MVYPAVLACVILFGLALPLVGETHQRLQVTEAVPSISPSQPPETLADARSGAGQSVIATGSPASVGDFHPLHVIHRRRKRAATPVVAADQMEE